MKNVLDYGVNAEGWVETRAIQSVIDLAEEGEVVYFPSAKGLDGEEYIIEGEPLIITKSITIKGEGTKTKLIQRSPNKPVILVSPTENGKCVNIKDLLIVSGACGVLFSSSFVLSPLSVIENVYFANQASSSVSLQVPDCNILINNIKCNSSQFGISVQNSSSYERLIVSNSTFKNITNRAIQFEAGMPTQSGNVVFDNVGFLNNNDAIYSNNVSIYSKNVYFVDNVNNLVMSGTAAFITGSGGGGGPSTPLAHSASHMLGGTDQIDLTGLSGTLSTPQTPTFHALTHLSGGTDAIPLATTSSSGLISSFDKAKIDATTPYVLLVKPSGVVGAGTYDSFDSLYSYYQTLGDAPCKILFDASLIAPDPILIISGSYNINRATSFEAASYSGGATGLLFSGATFNRLNSVVALALYNTGSYPVVTISGSEFGEVTSFQGNAFIGALGSAPFMKIKTSTVVSGNGTFTILSGNHQAIELEYPGAGSPVGLVLPAGQGFGLQENSIKTAGPSELAYAVIITLTEGTAKMSLNQPDYSSVAGSLNSLMSSYSKARTFYVGEVSSNFDSTAFSEEAGIVTIDSSGGPLTGSLSGISSHLLKGTTVIYKKTSNDSNEIKIFPISGSGDTIDGASSGSMSEPYSLRSYLNLGDGRWILKDSIK